MKNLSKDYRKRKRSSSVGPVLRPSIPDNGVDTGADKSVHSDDKQVIYSQSTEKELLMLLLERVQLFEDATKEQFFEVQRDNKKVLDELSSIKKKMKILMSQNIFGKGAEFSQQVAQQHQGTKKIFLNHPKYLLRKLMKRFHMLQKL